MNKIKFLLIMLFLILFVTGCSANANINVHYDGKVTEIIDVTNSNDNIKYGNKNIKNSIDLFLKKYSAALRIGKYTTDVHVGKKYSGVKISRTYDNFCSFIRGTIFSQYVYKSFDCIENDFYYEIKNVGNVVKNTDRYDTWLSPEEKSITITLPISADDQNADETNGNNYTWKYDNNTLDSKSFYLKISKNALKEYEQKYLKKIENQKTIKRIAAICIVTLIIVVGIIIAMRLYKKYKKNNFEY